ncbi:MAG: 30S ribosomal protein S12 methylthiotransferase RimO [Candidatus Zixiibacteriota bacterium]|nr:MAG: 30S ribosomal protein S12 methylthiotransferase RimO [candidate division Zixibacteria bacterium]
MARTVWIESLGCPKNEVDGERMQSALTRKGFKIADDRSRADVLILNTCGFIQSAKEESIEEIFNLIALKSQNGRKKILVCGCLAQRYPNELWTQMPEVDGLFGIGEIDKVGSICSSVLQGKRTLSVSPLGRPSGVAQMKRTAEKRPYAYIKIADGCDNLCSYCAIPAIRGDFRSKKIKDVLEEARQLAENGVKEINLIAQDTTLYGIDLYGERRLPRLLASLSRISGLEWIRLLYTHPAHFSDELIDQIASDPKVCKYVDLPLQHISDQMLTKMNRKVSRKKVENLIQKLRERIPCLTLRTSFIVGFPGEKKKHFGELLKFVEEVRFDKLGAFPYSKEEDTKAYSLKGQVPSALKQERLDELMLTQQKIAFEKNEAKMGGTLTVLIDNKSEEAGCFLGRSQGEAPEVDGTIRVKGKEVRIGRLVKVEIVDWCGYDLIGQQTRE